MSTMNETNSFSLASAMQLKEEMLRKAAELKTLKLQEKAAKAELRAAKAKAKEEALRKAYAIEQIKEAIAGSMTWSEMLELLQQDNSAESTNEETQEEVQEDQAVEAQA